MLFVLSARLTLIVLLFLVASGFFYLVQWKMQ